VSKRQIVKRLRINRWTVDRLAAAEPPRRDALAAIGSMLDPRTPERRNHLAPSRDSGRPACSSLAQLQGLIAILAASAASRFPGVCVCFRSVTADGVAGRPFVATVGTCRRDGRLATRLRAGEQRCGY
jgi:hypothetical protein